MNTLAEQLAATLRAVAHAYAAGDQVPPCAVLWADPDRLWERAMPVLKPILPELFLLGSYSPDERTGPALWLRCIEARVIEGAPESGTTPIFTCLTSAGRRFGPSRIAQRNSQHRFCSVATTAIFRTK